MHLCRMGALAARTCEGCYKRGCRVRVQRGGRAAYRGKAGSEVRQLSGGDSYVLFHFLLELLLLLQLLQC